jgi:glycosyl transferase family 25
MPPIRYINLDRDTARRAALEGELKRLGLEAERFPAILWNALPQTEQNLLYSVALNARQHHLPLVNGEKGCYASHIRLWQWLLEGPQDCLVVLEDDVRLEDSFAEVCTAVAALSQPWDMVKLIGREGLGKGEKLAASRPLAAGHALVRYRRLPSLTAAYVIHRRGAQKLLGQRLPFGRPIDVDLRHWWECEDLAVLGVRPAAVQLAVTSQESSINATLKSLSWPQRWHKFLLKTRYTLANAWHAKS